MPTQTFPDGTIITVLPVPPIDFDPLRADQESLRRYGYPRRPDERPELLTRWAQLFGQPFEQIKPIFRMNENIRFGIPIQKINLEELTRLAGSWSGAIVFVASATDGSFINSVGGTWNVPSLQPPTDDGTCYRAASWVGIDSGDILQAGVECEVMSQNGVMQRNIYPWVEWFPDKAKQITNFPVSAGDVVTCIIQGSETFGLVNIINETQGKKVTPFTVSNPSKRRLVGNCAEWIVERPDLNGTPANLANYGEVTFNNALATDTETRTITASTGDTIDMVDANGSIISSATISNRDIVTCVYKGS